MDIELEVKKLSPVKGDILTITYPDSDLDSKVSAMKFARTLGQMHPGVTFAVLPSSHSLTLNKDADEPMVVNSAN